ncbi:MAG: MFS transporter [Gammaproteobacteria bacterium RIFOXYA12_FULL_61_12]|nr:MAG: MFS transporter [Gammaproteobacteria bacterium RIFOXYD12_FULL_61_37]OGT92467.1 MAG: MFS transporter [Gammaproteobacteria bacterium RIFOXYA12_FULL_61_12]
MPDSPAEPCTWRESLRAFLHPRVVTMLFLGFSAGIPLLLIFSSLSLWLGEAGVERKSVTFFSWAALAYSFKFVWAPLIDKLPLPFLTQWLGRRRAWLLVAQCSIMVAIVLMGMIDPASGQDSLVRMALAAVLLGFSAATQDIVIDAYRIESAESRLQALMSSTYIAGYRLGMVVSGAGALFLAASFGSEKGQYVHGAWQSTYLIMACTILVGVVTTLLIPEPERRQLDRHHYTTMSYIRLLAVFAGAASGFVGGFFLGSEPFAWLKLAAGGGVFTGFLLEALHFFLAIGVAVLIGWALVLLGLVNRDMARDTWVEPIADFFRRYGLKTALLLLALIGFYRISDIVLGVISNVFYQDMGFSKVEIATAVKTFGVVVSIFGGIFGGLLVTRFGVVRILMLGAVLAVAANAVFILLAHMGHNLPMMYLAVGFDNFEAGLAGAAFIAFISSLTSVSFTAVQYAIFSSLMTLFPKVIGGYSGTIVDGIGYPGFFTFTSLIGVPVLILVWIVGKRLEIANPNKEQR